MFEEVAGTVHGVAGEAGDGRPVRKFGAAEIPGALVGEGFDEVADAAIEVGAVAAEAIVHEVASLVVLLVEEDGLVSDGVRAGGPGGELLLMAASEDPEAKRDGRSLYNVAGKYYGAILDHLTGNKMGASVIVLTHIMQTGDTDDQGKIIGKARDVPVGVGVKFSKKMQTYFSDIWHLEVDRAGNRTFKTAATDKASLRTSAPTLIKAAEPYDLASMLDRLTIGA